MIMIFKSDLSIVNRLLLVIRHITRLKCLQEIEKSHKRLRFPVCFTREKDWYILVFHVSVWVQFPYCVYYLPLCFIIDAYLVYIIISTNLLVPEIQSVHPVVADPARIVFLQCLEAPLTTTFSMHRMTKYSRDRQVLFVSEYLNVTFVEKRFQLPVLSIARDLFCLPFFLMFHLIFMHLDFIGRHCGPVFLCKWLKSFRLESKFSIAIINLMLGM